MRRNDQVITEFDLYDLLRKGDKSHDVQLLPGDVIYIPPAGQQVAIIGSVNEPGIYEIKGDETVASALEDAGGATNLADQDRVLLERIENHEGRQLESFAMDEVGMKRTLRDGDLLRVYPLSPRFDNAVTLRGNVAQPGRYATATECMSPTSFLIANSAHSRLLEPTKFSCAGENRPSFRPCAKPVRSPDGNECAEPGKRADRRKPAKPVQPAKWI
ncbi:MAG: SLBB domain-containing protein [Terracidiphilus sp.]